MDTPRGVVLIAYGRSAREQAAKAIATLRKQHDWPIVVVGDKVLPSRADRIKFPALDTPAASARWAKTNLNNLTPFERTLYIDADMRVYGSLEIGFGLLDRGAELVMVPSLPQGHEVLRHLSDQERASTLNSLRIPAYQFNTGLIFFRDTPRTIRLFEVWREEWKRWKGKDQGAFLRALDKYPVALRLLGPQFNSRDGLVCEHLFGIIQ